MAKIIKIEKRIPIPPIVRHSSVRIYPFDKLKIGDSFLFSSEDCFRGSVLANKIKRKLKVKLIVRNTLKGLRVWRVG